MKLPSFALPALCACILGLAGCASWFPQSAQTPPWEENNSQLAQDQQPFAYNAPEVDYWYNSGYEESLYSPFAFDGD